MDAKTIVTGQGEPSHLFGPALHAAIDRAIAALPAEKRGQVELRITLEGVEADAAVRLVRDVTAAVFWQRKTGGEQSAGARVRWSF